LGRIGIQVAGWNDSDAVMLPVHDLHDSRILVRGVGGSAVFDLQRTSNTSLTGSRTGGSRCAQARRDVSFYQAGAPAQRARPFARGCLGSAGGKLGVPLG
jgi:hypothetical protein